MDQEQVKEGHRYFGVELNNRAWDLIAKPDRSEQENYEMVAAAMGSWFHWMNAGTEVNTARADGTISRALSAIGSGTTALDYAGRYLAACRSDIGCEDWDIAFAYAAAARAYAACGDAENWRANYDNAVKAGAAIQDEENRITFEDDMRLPPWHGMPVSTI